MKGHVGGGSRSGGFKAPATCSKLTVPTCPITYPYVIEIVQERLLEMSGLARGIPPGACSDIKLESLILAQNERWRHA